MDDKQYSLEELMILLESSLVKDFNDNPLPISIKAPILEKVSASFNAEKDKVMNQAYDNLNEMMKAKQEAMNNEEKPVEEETPDEVEDNSVNAEDPRQ